MKKQYLSGMKNELATNVGISSTAVTVKEILAVLEDEPSDAVRTKLPNVFRSEFAFSSDANDILDN